MWKAFFWEKSVHVSACLIKFCHHFRRICRMNEPKEERREETHLKNWNMHPPPRCGNSQIPERGKNYSVRTSSRSYIGSYRTERRTERGKRRSEKRIPTWPWRHNLCDPTHADNGAAHPTNHRYVRTEMASAGEGKSEKIHLSGTYTPCSSVVGIYVQFKELLFGSMHGLGNVHWTFQLLPWRLYMFTAAAVQHTDQIGNVLFYGNFK